MALDVPGGQQRDGGLPDQLESSPHADAAANVHEIVDRAEDPDADERQHGRQGVGILDPHRHRQEHHHDDEQHAAHGRRARLGEVPLRSFDPDPLAVAEPAEQTDVHRAEGDHAGKGQQEAHEDADHVHQGAPRSASASTTRSSPMPREASACGSTCTRTAYFCEPNTFTCATPFTVEIRCAR